MQRLETDRLILRDFSVKDLEDFYAYCSLPTVGPNAGWAVHQEKAFSLKIIQNFIEKQEVWAIELKANQTVIGSVGLHKKTTNKGTDFYEIGYVLSTPYEGRGLMTEAVKEVLKYAFLTLNIETLHVCHFVENQKSRRVIEKCGFEYTHVGIYETLNFGKKESLYYQLTKTTYLKQLEEKS